MKRCQTCAEQIPDKATRCPRCLQQQSFVVPPGKPTSTNNSATIIVLTASALILAGVGFSYFRQNISSPLPIPAPSGVAPAVLPSEERPAAQIAKTELPAPADQCGASDQSAKFIDVVKKRLLHPDSFEPVMTSRGPVSSGRVTIIMTYKAAKDSGGGTGVAIGKVNLSDCGVTIDVMT